MKSYKSSFVVLCAMLAMLALAGGQAHAANGTAYYFDINGDTPGFGTPSGEYDITPDGAYWSSDSTGSSATVAFPSSYPQMTFGDTGSDFDGAAFTINFGGDWFWLQGLAVNSTNAHITLAGGNLINNYDGNPVTSWYVATGSTLDVTGNYGGIGGMNWGGYAVSFTGGGTFNFFTGPGYNGGSTTITQSGPVVNLRCSTMSYTEGWTWLTMAKYTLTEGTLNFATADAANVFRLYGNNDNALTISGGTIDNTSGSAMTLDLKGGWAGQGIIKLSGDFTFSGSSDLSFGTAPVTLTATPQITVTTNNLTIGGIIDDGSSGFGLTKAGAGTLTLTGGNSYTGNTTVNEGPLSIANPYLDIASTVTVAAAGATLDLNFVGTNTVAALIIGSTPQADGVYGALSSGAEHEIAQITGTGRLRVSSSVGTAESTTALVRNSGTGALSTLGDSLSFDVTVSGSSGAPTGKVSLKDGGSSGTTLGTGTLTASGTNGICTITTTTLTLGTHDNIVAVYRGDSTYAASTSSALSPAQVVYPINLQRPYLDTDGATAGFQATDGATYNFSDSVWNSEVSGVGPLGAFSYDGADPAPTLTIGTAPTDFDGLSFTINADNPGFWWIYNGIAVNSTNVHVTLSGANLLNADVVGETWSVAAGSTLTVNGNYGGIGGLNWGGGANGVSFTGGGTFNFVTAPGVNAGGTTITHSGPVVNLQAPSLAADAGAGWSWLTLAKYTLTAGTLNFATADAAGAFRAYGNNNGVFTITGGTIDNTSGSAMTLDLKGIQAGQGTISIGGDFTFTGSSDLSFGTAPVTLTATPQITVAATNLTIGGEISGSGFGLTKAGAGTLTLAGTNAYTGDTTVNDGILRLTHPIALATNTSVYLSTTAGTLDLPYIGTNKVTAIYVNGTPQGNGVFGSSSLAMITGGGFLQVGETAKPTASFSVNTTNGFAPLKVSFTDTSTDGGSSITGRHWDFGNRLLDTLDTNVTNTFTNANTYTVWLTVTNDLGFSSTNITISVTNVPPPTFVGGSGTFNVNSSGQATFKIVTTNGVKYRILYNDDLLNTGGWTNVVTPPGWTNGIDGTIQIQDTSTSGATQRFYRIEAESVDATP